jgi:hypothetical protein
MSARNPIVSALAGALVALLAAPFARAQTSATVHARLSSGVVRFGESAALIVTVENARAAELGPLPAVEGLSLARPDQPSSSVFEQWVNGRRSRSVSLSWSIVVRPERVGEFEIPSLELTVDGERVQTDALRLTVVADLEGEELGFFEVRVSSAKVVEGEPFTLELSFGFDQALQQRTNYYNLALPWWGELPGVLAMETAPARPGAKLYRFYLNGRSEIEVEMLEPREVRGRPFFAFRVVRSFTPTRTGKVEIPVSFFEFGHVAESLGFFGGRRDKTETFFARSAPLSVDVVALPEAGRPLDFSGAIGRLAARATAEPRDVDAGESIKLAVTWTGAGNLEFFTPPDPARIEAFRGFRVYGRTDDKAFDRRTVVYDLAPLSSEVREIPPLPLTVFDPEAGRYTTVATAPIEIRVRALEGAASFAGGDEAERFAVDIRDIVREAAPEEEPGGVGVPIVAAWLASTPIAWLALRTLVRRRADPSSPAERARRRARRELSRSLARAGDARAQADRLYAFLAARTKESATAWVGRDLAAYARERGLDLERVRPLADLLRELEREAWGGGGAALARERLLEAADSAVRGGL